MRKLALLLCTICISLVFIIGATACGDDKKYDVNFIVDGEIYKSVGTDGDEEIELPKTPTFGSHKFEGWFVDDGTFSIEFTSTYLLDNPINKDLNVYAKFEDTHKHHYEVTFVPKTCTTGGYKEFKCSCGHKYIGEEELPLGHALGLYETLTEATCKEEGSEKAICLRDGCQYSVTRKIPISQEAHVYGEDYKCVNCGKTSTENVKLPNGLVVSKGAIVKYEPTDTGLIDLVVPEYLNEIKITKIASEVFKDCESLKTITLPSSIEEIEGNAFYNCKNLEGVYVKDLKDWLNIKFTGMYSNPINNDKCKKLYVNNVLLEELSIPESITAIGAYAFFNCESITKVTIHSNLKSIGANAFRGCKGLLGVYIKDLEKWCGIEFDGTFSNPINNPKCYKLYVNDVLVDKLVIPSTVVRIERYAFYMCTSIKEITIPTSVNFIGKYAFSGVTTNLQKFVFEDVHNWVGGSTIPYTALQRPYRDPTDTGWRTAIGCYIHFQQYDWVKG